MVLIAESGSYAFPLQKNDYLNIHAFPALTKSFLMNEYYKRFVCKLSEDLFLIPLFFIFNSIMLMTNTFLSFGSNYQE